MATTPTQIRIDAELKKEATELFTYLGLDMSSAVNLFLRQCVLHEGLPFNVEVPHVSHQVTRKRVTFVTPTITHLGDDSRMALVV